MATSSRTADQRCRVGFGWSEKPSFGMENAILGGVEEQHFAAYAVCGCPVFIARDKRGIANPEMLFPNEHNPQRERIVPGCTHPRPTGSPKFYAYARLMNPGDDIFDPPWKEHDAEWLRELDYAARGPAHPGGYGRMYFPEKYVVTVADDEDMQGRIVGMTSNRGEAKRLAHRVSQERKRRCYINSEGWTETVGPSLFSRFLSLMLP